MVSLRENPIEMDDGPGVALFQETSVYNPPSNFSYEMGRTWATVQIASQVFCVQTGGVGPPFLYLHSFCS